MSILQRLVNAGLTVTATVLLVLPFYSPVVSAEAPSGDITGSAPTQSVCEGGLNSELNNSAICQGAQQGSDTTKNPIIGPNSIMAKVVEIIVFLVGALSVIMIVVGGFRYVVSGGDSNATKGAKDTILYALIGLVVALFAQGLVSFVLTRSFF